MKNMFQKTIVQVAFYLIVIICLIVFVLIPEAKGIALNKKAISNDKVELANLDAELTTLKKLSETSTEIEQKTAIISKYLPDTLDSSSFIVETEGLAKSLNLVIENFSITGGASASSEDGTQPQSQFTISLKSSFGQTLAFIEQLENLARFNTVSSVSLSAGDGDQISIQLTGQIYYGSK